MPIFDFPPLSRSSHNVVIYLLLAAFLLLATLALAMGSGLSGKTRVALSQAEINTVYEAPLPAPDDPLRVFHLGHSLVGRDLPAMVQQLAAPGHAYEVQLGWGTPLKAHWEKDTEINGFDDENAHERYRDARMALTSGEYDAFVATEMVEIRDAIAYHASAHYLTQWAELARRGNSDVRIYLYETWPRLDDPEGWLARLDLDLGRYWEAEIVDPALGALGPQHPIHVIPVGQVFASFVRAVESVGGVDNLRNREGLFRKNASGGIDQVHPNDLGMYLAALTHYAVLYHANPAGLPRQLLRADGSPADAPEERTARLMQEIVWDVVTSYPRAGLPQAGRR